jgi:hypothetical protein
MAGLNKFLKGFKNEHILGIVGLVLLVLAFYKYSENKNLFKLGMTPGPKNLNPAPVSGQVQAVSQNSNSQYAPYNGVGSAPVSGNSSAMNTAVANKPIANPSDLLPNDSNSSWASLNPLANGDLKNVNLLNPTQVVGINTQGSSLRNANLQLRSEPSNPRMNTNCPWNVSTIEGDKFRKQLEIGSSV